MNFGICVEERAAKPTQGKWTEHLIGTLQLCESMGVEQVPNSILHRCAEPEMHDSPRALPIDSHTAKLKGVGTFERHTSKYVHEQEQVWYSKYKVKLCVVWPIHPGGARDTCECTFKIKYLGHVESGTLPPQPIPSVSDDNTNDSVAEQEQKQQEEEDLIAISRSIDVSKFCEETLLLIENLVLDEHAQMREALCVWHDAICKN